MPVIELKFGVGEEAVVEKVQTDMETITCPYCSGRKTIVVDCGVVDCPWCVGTGTVCRQNPSRKVKESLKVIAIHLGADREGKRIVRYYLSDGKAYLENEMSHGD